MHAYEIGMLLDLIDTLEAKTAELDSKIEKHLAALPGVPRPDPLRPDRRRPRSGL